MAESELHRKGEAIGKLRGDADFARNKSEYDKDPVMKKFINVATKTVFGALWAAGLDFNHLPIGRNIGHVEGAEGRLQCKSSSKTLLIRLPGNCMAGAAATRLEHQLAIGQIWRVCAERALRDLFRRLSQCC